MTENIIVGVDLIPNPGIQIGTISRKVLNKSSVLLATHLGRNINLKNCTKTKEKKKNPKLLPRTIFHQKAQVSGTTICQNPNQGNTNAYIHNPKILLA